MTEPQFMKALLTGRLAAGAAFLAALLVILVQIALKMPDRLQPDEHTYLEIINDVVRTGIYTDGGMAAKERAGQPGRFIAPAFPLIVAGIAKADRGFADTLACFGSNQKAPRNACGRLWPFTVVNAAIAALGLVGIFLIARLLTQSAPVAWTALGVALASGEPAGFARLLLTDTLATTTFTLCLASLVALTIYGGRRLAVACGAALGLAALTRPSFVYLLYLIAAGLLLAGLLRARLPTAVHWTHAPIVLVAALVVMAPWMVRNVLLFGDAALTAGYGGFTLVQRVSYNAMTWGEWAAAWVFWFPDIGDGIAKAIFRPELVSRLGWNAPETFYKVGLGPLMQATEAAAGGPQHHVGYLIRNYVLGDLLKHSAVTLVLAWRGLWVGKWLAVVALLLLWPACREIVRKGRLLPLLALLLPLAALVGLHAFVSVSIARYNLPLLALFSIAIAMPLVALWQRLAATGR